MLDSLSAVTGTPQYQAALALADRGIPTFPCRADKSPATRRGFHDATVDPQPADYGPDTLVGMPTGAASGFAVLDLDPRNGSEAWLQANAARLPRTKTVHTRSGGKHLWFRAPRELRCSAGRVAPGVDIRADGGYIIDWSAAGQQVEDGDTVADWPDWLLAAARPPTASAKRTTGDIAAPSVQAVVELLDAMPNPESTDRDTYVRVMMAARGCCGAEDHADVATAAVRWAARWPGSQGEDYEAGRWEDDFSRRHAPLAGWPNLLAAAARMGVETSAWRAMGDSGFDAAPAVAPTLQPGHMRMQVLRPVDCASGQRRGYTIKGMIAPGDVAAIVGAPGSGKSQLAPYLAYAVAQGRPVFGLRTRQGNTLYLAAEDMAGMRQRVHALLLRHGDAPDFALGDCGHLGDATNRAELFENVKSLKPALVVLDTIGAAFAGMDENTSEAMGQVVKLARQVAATGAAVILVHHVAKAGDGTPRGHSSLNGTLDMCLLLTAADDNKVVRGSLTKNRNGSCDTDIAFRTTPVSLGEDEDGDDITAPVAVELHGAVRAETAKLSGQEQVAMKILRELDPAGVGVPEASFYDAAEDQRLSTSENPRNRRTATGAVVQSLRRKDVLIVSHGLLRVRMQEAGFPPCNQPATAENGPQSPAITLQLTPGLRATNAIAPLKGNCVVAPLQAVALETDWPEVD